MAARARAKASDRPAKRPVLAWAGWITLGTLWALVVVSLAGYHPADRPTFIVDPPNQEAANPCGLVGAHIAHWLYHAFGYTAWVLLIGAGAAVILVLARKRVDQLVIRSVGLALAVASLAGINALVMAGVSPMPGLAGGVLGDRIAAWLASLFSVLGSMVFLTGGLLVGLLAACNEPIEAGARWVAHRFGPAASGTVKGARITWTAAASLTAKAASAVRPRPKPALVRVDDLEDDERIQRPTKRSEPVIEAKPKKHKAAAKKESKRAERKRKKAEPVLDEEDGGLGGTDRVDMEPEVAVEAVGADDYEDDEDDLPGAPQVFDQDALREKISRLPVRFAAKDRKTATDSDLEDLQNVAELEGYQFPGMDLLAEPEENFSEKLEGLVREQAEALEAALTEYRINGEVVGIESGPVITLYHIRLAPGTRVNSLQTVSQDIARSLKAVNIRIVSNMVGRDTVGIEVPNPTKEKVRLKELMSNREWFGDMKLPMFLGKDASGEPLIEDLTKMPHMLIAGTTGSGKSVCMNTIIMSFLYTKKPNELKLVLVDPKMVEMSQFKDIPHLMCPVVTEMSKAAAILEWAVKKMDERYELLAEAGCRDIAGYNDMPWEELKEAFDPQTPEEEARIPRRLPYMVFIIDELADLMMTNKEVEGSIIRIAQKARAVGIHLILATQRPQANVVTGLIKSNMPCRVTFKVASGMDSRIVLDQKGGELLLGQGDMLLLSPRSHKLVRSQGTLVDDKEIRRVVRFMREVAAPTFERQLMQLRSGADPDDERLYESENNSSASLAAAQEDPLFDRAVEIVLETKRGSVSLLQRRLAIGYTRASRLIDLMGIAGIISEHKGSVARDVMITEAEWEAIKELAAQEAAGRPPAQGELFPEPATVATAAEGTGDDDAPWDDDESSDEEEDEEAEGEDEEEWDEDAEEEIEDSEEDEDTEEDEDAEEDAEDEDEEGEDEEDWEEGEEGEDDEWEEDEDEDDEEWEEDEDAEEAPDEDEDDRGRPGKVSAKG